jgi:hypothetical protein
MGLICPRCGRVQIDGAKFCQDCGTPLPNENEPGTSYASQPFKNGFTPASRGRNGSSIERYICIGLSILALLFQAFLPIFTGMKRNAGLISMIKWMGAVKEYDESMSTTYTFMMLMLAAFCLFTALVVIKAAMNKRGGVLAFHIVLLVLYIIMTLIYIGAMAVINKEYGGGIYRVASLTPWPFFSIGLIIASLVLWIRMKRRG